jgi:MFS superfamily sulfate permease-like transporter
MAYGLVVGNALGGEWSGYGVLAALMGSAVACLAGAILGGCPVLLSGPRAAVVLVLVGLFGQVGVLPGFAASPEVLLALGGVAVAGAGVIQLAFSVLRLGRLASYIPVPVVAGFINSSAILLVLSQVWAATGVPAQRSVLAIADHWGDIRPATLLLSLGTAAVILKGSRWFKPIPPAPAGIILGTAAYHLAAAMGFEAALGGTMAPPPSHIDFSFLGPAAVDILLGPMRQHLVQPLLVAAVTIAALASMDTLLSVTACDQARQHRSDISRQLIADGVANITVALFGMLPSSGSMARTAPALRQGMTTALGPILVAAFTAAAAMLLGPVIGLLPNAVMAGLLIALAIHIFDKWTIATVRRWLRAPGHGMAARSDFLAVGVVMLTTLVFNLGVAVAVGILISLVAFAVQMARSPVRRVYRADTLPARIHGDAARQRFLARHGARIAVIEMDGALFYGSAAPLEDAVDALVADGVVHVVCDLKRVRNIDVSGARMLERIHAKLTKLGGLLAVGYVERERRTRDLAHAEERRRGGGNARPVWRKLAFLGTIAEMGEDHFLPDTRQALLLCEHHLAARVAEEDSQPEEGLAHAAILRGLDRADVRNLRNAMTIRQCRPGEAFFAQGEPADSIYFIASGAVDIVMDLPGTERKLRLQSLTRGAVFGEMAIITPSPRSAAVIAQQPTRCYRLDAETFARLKDSDPKLAFCLLSNIADLFAQRLRVTNTILAELEA